MEIRAVSAELALSEARQLEAEQRLKGGAEELYREMEVYRVRVRVRVRVS